jgi:hypothetical protein
LKEKSLRALYVKHVPILECKSAKVGYKPAKPWAQEDQEDKLLIPGIPPEKGIRKILRLRA